MNDKDMSEFDSSVRMSDFAAANSVLFKNTPKIVNGFVSLNADIAELETTGAARVSTTGLRTDGTADKAATKSALTAYLRKIVKTAKLIKAEEPEFDNKFKFSRGNVGGEELLTVARAFANDLPPVAAKFEEYVIKGDPVVKLNALVADFEAARTQQNTGKGGGIAATAQTKTTVKRLSKTRAMLKIVVTNLLEDLDDAGKLAEWKAACRVEKAAKKTKTDPPTT